MEAGRARILADMRGRYEGMWNVMRFNWPKYAFGVAVVLAAAVAAVMTAGTWSIALTAFALLSVEGLMLPLVASHMIYDRSDLYALSWLDDLDPAWDGTVLNINAGFDEISASMQRRFPRCEIHVVDFYDAHKHTEPSIERARAVYPAFPGTRPVDATRLPFPDKAIDLALAFLSLHEIRDEDERIRALSEMHRTLKPTGRLMVTEHLRDVANFCAFNIGFFHFHSRAAWMRAFSRAGFSVRNVHRTTPFITTFQLVPR
jgi:SAM-dependent methyltransferase